MLTRSLFPTLILFLCIPAAAETIRVVIEPCGDLPTASMEVAALASVEGDQASPLLVERSGTVNEALDLPLAGGRTWRLYIESTAFWSEPGRAVDPARETVVRLPAFPRSGISGRLSVARGERLPSEIVLRLSRTERAQSGEAPADRIDAGRCSLEQAVVTCRVEDDGRYACAVPAGRWNVRLKAEGWAGRHLWDLALDPGRTRDIEGIELRHGSTFLGKVTTIDGPADPRITRVRLEPVSGREPGRGADPAIGRELRATARLNAQGFFVFEDLAPGGYTVVAHQPGYAPSAPIHVEVVTDRETALREPILLRPPLRLSARITPPVDPDDERWRIELARQAPGGEQLDRAASGRADREGRWDVEDLPPGRYRLEVVDGAGNPLAVEEPILLEGGGVELEVEIDLVEVTGAVLIGDEPLAGAELWFGGRFGPTRVRAAADDEGQFSTYLPKPGRWLIDVLSEEPRVVHEDRPVEVPEGGGELEIRLPDTRLSGRVIEESSGLPAGRSVVRVARVDIRTGASGVPTDDEGRFEVLALDSGSYVVQAEREDARSELVAVELREGFVPPELTLALRERRKLQGQVVSQHGGVPGARVEVLPLAASGELVEMSVPSALTDAAGGFTTEIPPDTREVLVTVLPPGFGLAVRRLTVDDLQIVVTPSDATLRIARPAEPDGGAADGDLELVMVDGQPIDVPTLLLWVAMHGGGESEGELVVPAMPAGPYRYCRARFEEAMAVFTGRAAPTRCTGGMLIPGGELRLSMP